MIKTAAKSLLFHLNTLLPSSGGKGIKLNSANQRFSQAIQSNMVNTTGLKAIKVIAAKARLPMTIFVAGPARAIFPSLSLSYNPANCTAPGAANMNPNIEVTRAIKIPTGHNLKNATAPSLLATVL